MNDALAKKTGPSTYIEIFERYLGWLKSEE